MTVDYPGAIDHIFTSGTCVFTDALTRVANADITIINHKTACGAPCTATQVADDYCLAPEMKSSHFIVGRDGSVTQCVLLKDGAGANCCTSTGYNASYYDPLMAKYSNNVNLFTVSIEHEDWSVDNSQVMTPEQVEASNALNLWLCQRYGIGVANIHSHASIDPVNRARCPGPTFDFNQLFTYIEDGGKPPVPPTKKPNPPTGDMLKQFETTWAEAPNIPTGTGIYEDWLLYSQVAAIGYPACAEYDNVDWNGAAIREQWFVGGANAQWNVATSTARWWVGKEEITF